MLEEWGIGISVIFSTFRATLRGREWIRTAAEARELLVIVVIIIFALSRGRGASAYVSAAFETLEI
jgi:hypothetical protein